MSRNIPNTILSMGAGRLPDIIAPTNAPVKAGMNKLFSGIISSVLNLLLIMVAESVRKNIVVRDKVIASCILRFITIT